MGCGDSDGICGKYQVLFILRVDVSVNHLRYCVNSYPTIFFIYKAKTENSLNIFQ